MSISKIIMFEKYLTRITIIIFLLTVILSAIGCVKKIPTRESNRPSVFDGSISNALGCIFAPDKCDQIKDMSEQEKKKQEEEITKEYEEMDNGKL